MAAEVAFAEIQKQRGRQFDPNYADGFLAIRSAILQEMQVQSAQAVSGRRTRTIVAQ
jgi:response regulator RpfG family c-di-GMP phosphodiesterase